MEAHAAGKVEVRWIAQTSHRGIAVIICVVTASMDDRILAGVIACTVVYTLIPSPYTPLFSKPSAGGTFRIQLDGEVRQAWEDVVRNMRVRLEGEA